MAKKMTNPQLNEAYKNLVEEFSSFKNEVGNVQNTINQKVKEYLDNLESQKNELSEFRTAQTNQTTAIISQITEQKAELTDFYFKLIGNEDSIETKINEVKNEIDLYYKELFEGDEEKEAIRNRITTIYKELSDYKKKVFGFSKKDENNELIHIPGVKDTLDDLIKQYEDRIKEFDEGTSELIEKKEGEMNQLLEKMGLNYNAVEQEALSKKFFELSANKNSSIIKSNIILIVSSLLLTLALIILFALPSLQELFKGNNVIAGALIRIAITSPIMYLIVITSNRMKRESVIRDQYNFKGSIMSTYRNISTHIKNETIDISGIKQTELLEKVFNTVLENEADKLEKSDQFSIKHFSKVLGSLAKELGTDKQTLASIIPKLMGKLDKENISSIASAQTTDGSETIT